MLHACSRAAGSWADRRPRLHLRRQGAKKPAEWLAGLPFGPPKERAINLRAWPQVVPSIPQRWGVQKIALGRTRTRQAFLECPQPQKEKPHQRRYTDRAWRCDSP